jgi:hypothetical protein
MKTSNLTRAALPQTVRDEAPQNTADTQVSARRARHYAAPLVRFDTLNVGDVFSLDRLTAVVEVEVTGAPVEVTDLFGRKMQNLPCMRLDTRVEGMYMFGPDGQARKVVR